MDIDWSCWMVDYLEFVIQEFVSGKDESIILVKFFPQLL